MNHFAACFLCICLGLVTQAYAEAPPAACKLVADTNILSRRADLATASLPAADDLQAVLDCNAPRVGHIDPPISNWLTTERATYAAVLENAKAQTLVVPFQVQGLALDRVERSLMSMDLSYEIGAATPVADPTLVARALGEGARRYTTSAILDLARRMGARKVVIPFVGHDGNGSMTLSIQIQDLAFDPQGAHVLKTEQHDWRSIAFTDEKPPFLQFHELLPRVMTSFSLTPARHKQARSVDSTTNPLAVGRTPAELLAATGMSPSAKLSILGALESPVAERAQERLFARALIDSLRFDPPGSHAK